MGTPTTTTTVPASQQADAPKNDALEVIATLSEGRFVAMLNQALGECAGNAVALQGKSSITINLELKHIPGTKQVHIGRTLKFTAPTLEGKRTIEATLSTPMHVSRGGVLSFQPPNQRNMFDKDGNLTM